MKSAVLVLFVALFFEPAFAAKATSAARTENRCGWWQNPTPGNAWLVDKDGLWIVGTQGGHQADGDWPPFDIEDEKTFVRTGSSYGFGCACLKFTANGPKSKQNQVEKVLSATVKPLSQCRKDKALKEPENPLAE